MNFDKEYENLPLAERRDWLDRERAKMDKRWDNMPMDFVKAFGLLTILALLSLLVFYIYKEIL